MARTEVNQLLADIDVFFIWVSVKAAKLGKFPLAFLSLLLLVALLLAS